MKMGNILVHSIINEMPDRALLVREACKRSLVEPGASIFTRNRVLYFHATTATGDLYIGIYPPPKGEEFVPIE
jgi:hypothetical protein